MSSLATSTMHFFIIIPTNRLTMLACMHTYIHTYVRTYIYVHVCVDAGHFFLRKVCAGSATEPGAPHGRDQLRQSHQTTQGLRVFSCGVCAPVSPQIRRNLSQKGCDIVVGTPGTTVDFVQRNKIDTDVRPSIYRVPTIVPHSSYTSNRTCNCWYWMKPIACATER